MTHRNRPRREWRLRERAARRARRQSVSSGPLLDLAERLAADDEAFEIALQVWHAGGHQGPEPGTAVAARQRPLPLAGSGRAPVSLKVELAANAPAAVLAAVEAAIRDVAPRVAVELVRVPPQPGGEQLRIRGPVVTWGSLAAFGTPPSAAHRQERAMVAFAAALDAALAAAGDRGDRS